MLRKITLNKYRNIGLALGALLLLFTVACEDEKNTASCLDRLNEGSFESVAGDESCDDYERASAELALSGFSFTNFLDAAASQNFGVALGLVGKDLEEDVIPHYEAAMELAGPNYYEVTEERLGRITTTLSQAFATSGVPSPEETAANLTAPLKSLYGQRFEKEQEEELDEALKSVLDDSAANNEAFLILIKRFAGVRPNKELEITLFAALGRVTAETYGRIDVVMDGEITQEETNRFVGIVEPSEQGKTDIVEKDNDGNPTLQIVDSSGNVWLLRGTECVNNGKSYTGVFDESRVESDPTKCPTQAQSMNIVIQMKQLLRIFTKNNVFTEAIKFLQMYTQMAPSITNDLEDLGINDDHVLMLNVNDTVNRMDNGGGCSNAQAKSIVTFGKVVESFACIDQAGLEADDSGVARSRCNVLTTSLETANVVDSSRFTSIAPGFSSDNVTCPDNFKDACQDAGIRVIYQTESGSFTDYYAQASLEKVLEPIWQISFLALDKNGKFAESSANDEIITIEELMCLSEAGKTKSNTTPSQPQ